MSFILDALKKSEIERQRQSVPGLMDTRMGSRRNRLPLWALLLAGLLGINVVVLLIFMMRSAPTATAVTAKHVDAAAPAVAEHFSPLDSSPVYAPEIPVTPPAASNTSNAARPSGPLVVAPLAAPPHSSAPRALRKPDPVLIDEDAKADNDEVLPSINEINLTGAQALPELHLDVHVYATQPAERFVYINMRKYHEGSVLQEGPIVERIRRDGAVLNFQGLRFILPRQ
jgi:general secretion pathway protein B